MNGHVHPEHKRIYDYFERAEPQTPCVVIDREIVASNYRAFANAMPSADIYYAIKANPAPEILALLADLGSSFDAASLAEVTMALAAGAGPERISFGNTIKKERDIAEAFQLGIRLFAVDCIAEVEKVARVAPGSRIFCRLLICNDGAEWPLSRKFGCDEAMALAVICRAHELGLKPLGLSFHVGSQQTDPRAWDAALSTVSDLFQRASRQGIELTAINLGGGFPARYLKSIPSARHYADMIDESLRRHFGNKIPATMIEPGRGMVGNAGIIKSEVVLISTKSDDDDQRWVYLDIGKFGGLAETMDEAIRYPLRTSRDGDFQKPAVIAGPTCDSVDVLYEKTPYPMPVSLTIGDEIFIENTGAYTTTYAANGFNGFEPLQQIVI
ncbi:MAG: type III PLP-dependent enzyme [Pseudomonadota bacterium]